MLTRAPAELMLQVVPRAVAMGAEAQSLVFEVVTEATSREHGQTPVDF